MMVTLVTAFVVSACCGDSENGPCPCGVNDVATADTCGCSSCPAGYFWSDCSRECKCHEEGGVCEEGPDGLGFCACKAGYAERRCETVIPYIEKFESADLEWYLANGMAHIDDPVAPFQLTIVGGHFTGGVSATSVTFTALGPAAASATLTCDIVSVTSTHIVCDMSAVFKTYHGDVLPEVPAHYFDVVVESDGLTSDVDEYLYEAVPLHTTPYFFFTLTCTSA